MSGRSVCARSTIHQHVQDRFCFTALTCQVTQAGSFINYSSSIRGRPGRSVVGSGEKLNCSQKSYRHTADFLRRPLIGTCLSRSLQSSSETGPLMYLPSDGAHKTGRVSNNDVGLHRPADWKIFCLVTHVVGTHMWQKAFIYQLTVFAQLA